MQKIQRIVKYIDCELKHAEKYADAAANESAVGKDTDIISAYIKLAQVHMENADSLHSIAVKIIDKYKMENGDPPEVMRQLWAYEHTRYVDWASEIKYKIYTEKNNPFSAGSMNIPAGFYVTNMLLLNKIYYIYVLYLLLYTYI